MEEGRRRAVATSCASSNLNTATPAPCCARFDSYNRFCYNSDQVCLSLLSACAQDVITRVVGIGAAACKHFTLVIHV